MAADENAHGRRRIVPLRRQLIAFSTLLLLITLGGLAVVVSLQQKAAIEKQLEERALNIAQSLAAAAMADLLTYNYPALERIANKASRNPDVVYVVIQDKNFVAAGHSLRPDRIGGLLEDEYSKRAQNTDFPLTQETRVDGFPHPVLEVSQPVRQTPGEIRWGTVRVGLSTDIIRKQLRRTLAAAAVVGLAALVFGVLFSTWFAGKITTPLNQFVEATIRAKDGDLTREITTLSQNELAVLADNFNAMMRSLNLHKKSLDRKIQELDGLGRYLEALLDSMQNGLFSFTPQGELKRVNPKIGLLLGGADGALCSGSGLAEAFAGHPALLSLLDDLRRRPVDMDAREIILSAAGRERSAAVSAGVLRDKNGEAVEIICNISDITLLKQLESRLAQAKRLEDLGRLGASLAHEIRNPLTAIKTYVGVLPRKLAKEGFLEDFQATMRREINRITGLVDDLLELSRERSYPLDVVRLQDVADHVLKVAGPILEMSGIIVKQRVSEEGCRILGNMEQLEQAVMNLVKNAREAMPKGGTLSVEISCDPDPAAPTATLTVADTGPGIRESDLERIFTPFVSTKAQGTGLGLAATAKIIADHGGAVRAENTESGAGFAVTLPLLQMELRAGENSGDPAR